MFLSFFSVDLICEIIALSPHRTTHVHKQPANPSLRMVFLIEPNTAIKIDTTVIVKLESSWKSVKDLVYLLVDQSFIWALCPKTDTKYSIGTEQFVGSREKEKRTARSDSIMVREKTFPRME